MAVRFSPVQDSSGISGTGLREVVSGGGDAEDFDGGGYLRLLYKRASGLSDDSVVGFARRGGGRRCDQFFHLSGLSAVFSEGAGRRPAFSAFAAAGSAAING